MAIISCPVCNTRISNKATACPKCKTDLSVATPEKLASQHRERILRQSQSLMNQSMLALLLFLAGFGILYWWQPESGSYNQYVSTVAIALGFCWYIVCRARIIWLKRKQ